MTTPQITLPPAGPALTLHQAADRLRRIAQDATAGPWSALHPEERWEEYRDAELIGGGKPLARMNSEYNGHLNADYIAAMHPPLALDLADWLDAIACAAVKHAAGGYGNEQSEVTDGYPMTVALRILEA